MARPVSAINTNGPLTKPFLYWRNSVAEKHSILTQERLKELLHYDPETGVFIWRVRRGMALAGSVAGNRRKNGRIAIYVDDVEHKAARLAWLYVHGVHPEKFIDHINGDPGDDRLSNLREVTNSENMQNQRRARTNSSSGLLGVVNNGGKWQATIRLDGVRKYLGTFKTPEEAHQAYLEAKRTIHCACTI